MDIANDTNTNISHLSLRIGCCRHLVDNVARNFLAEITSALPSFAGVRRKECAHRELARRNHTD